jgi:peroxiredoxin
VELQSRYAEFEALGAQLWLVANDDPDKLAALKRDKGLEFPILPDPGAETIRAYGVLNEKHGSIAHPTALVIDSQGVVRFARVDENYRKRPEPEQLLDALRSLPEAAP